MLGHVGGCILMGVYTTVSCIVHEVKKNKEEGGRKGGRGEQVRGTDGGGRKLIAQKWKGDVHIGQLACTTSKVRVRTHHTCTQ